MIYLVTKTLKLTSQNSLAQHTKKLKFVDLFVNLHWPNYSSNAK